MIFLVTKYNKNKADLNILFEHFSWAFYLLKKRENTMIVIFFIHGHGYGDVWNSCFYPCIHSDPTLTDRGRGIFRGTSWILWRVIGFWTVCRCWEFGRWFPWRFNWFWDRLHPRLWKSVCESSFGDIFALAVQPSEPIKPTLEESFLVSRKN